MKSVCRRCFEDSDKVQVDGIRDTFGRRSIASYGLCDICKGEPESEDLDEPQKKILKRVEDKEIVSDD